MLFGFNDEELLFSDVNIHITGKNCFPVRAITNIVYTTLDMKKGLPFMQNDFVNILDDFFFTQMNQMKYICYGKLRFMAKLLNIDYIPKLPF